MNIGPIEKYYAHSSCKELPPNENTALVLLLTSRYLILTDVHAIILRLWIWKPWESS